MQEVHVELLRSANELLSFEPEWRSFLRTHVCGANHFNDPVFIQQQLILRRNITPWVVVLRRDGHIRCVAPFYSESTRRTVQLSVVNLATISAKMLSLCGANFIISADEDRREYVQNVLDVLWSQRGQYDLAFLSDLNVNDILWTSCSRSWRPLCFAATARVGVSHQIVFPSTHDEYLKTLSYETRRRLRRYTRKVLDQLSGRLEVITLPEQVPSFLRHLDDVYRDCWQSTHYGNRVRNTEPQVRFLQSIAANGWLRSYLLTNEDGPMAFALGYQYDGVWYFMETGYAQRWSHFSPGAVLFHLFVEDFYRAARPSMLDFLAGNQDYKQSFGNAQTEVSSIYLVPWNRWRLILACQSALYALERWARSIVVTLKLDRPLRKILARAGAHVSRNTQ